nr:bifunctional nuclease family protein [Corynebacterium ammoniagenes]
MTMNAVELEFLGVHMMEPEDFLCALMAHPASHKVVPVWMSLADGARLSSRADGYSPARPDTHDLLVDLVEDQGGVISIVINNVHEGAFFVEITTGAEKTLDARLSDALVLSLHFNVPITMDEEILSKVGVFVTEDDLDQYFDIDYADTSFIPGQTSRPSPEESDSTSASGDAQADADFSQLMQSMGLTEDELRLDDEDEDGEDEDGEGGDDSSDGSDSGDVSGSSDSSDSRDSKESDDDGENPQ